jgi:hypothetical protein
MKIMKKQIDKYISKVKKSMFFELFDLTLKVVIKLDIQMILEYLKYIFFMLMGNVQQEI